MSNEQRQRSILKALSYRLTGSLLTMLAAYFLTGEFLVAASIGGIEIVSKLLLYYWHERDRKSTRLNSSHVRISYAVFCLKKKKKYTYIVNKINRLYNIQI